MNKRRMISIIALLCAAVMILGGCNLIIIDEEKDRAEVVAKVGDEVITKGEVLAMYETYKGQYGLTDENEKTSGKETSEALKALIADQMIEQRIREIKAREAGYLNFTDENRAEAEETLEKQIVSGTQQYIQILGTESEDLARQMAESDFNSSLESMNLTRDQLVEQVMSDQAVERYMKDQVKDITGTAEEVRNKQQELLEKQKTSFDEDPLNYDDALSTFQTTEGAEPIVYRPAGYIRVKHILIAIPQDKRNEILDLQDTATDAPETDEQKEAQKEADRIVEEELAKLRDKAEEVLAKVESGEDFDKLIEEYGEDPGMTAEPYSEVGYEFGIDSSFDYNFKEASLSLRNVGDTTELVGSDFGYHIIKLLEKMPQGELSFEQVLPSIQAYVDLQLQNARRTEIMTAWKEEYKIDKYYSRMY